jgi:DNA polymerase III subunit delta'
VNAARTRGQPAALAVAATVVDEGRSHALLLVGPGGVGKTTLALDIAAHLLCTAEPAAARPCRACRGCRMVDSGNHPDLHRLAPDGPGGQIRIGERSNADRGTIRGLISSLALLPVEGGARVAILEAAHRLNDDAQSALLKTLEEPPSGVTIILCADDEERLLPTVRSRCARIRLGPVGARDIEAILGDAGAADAPTAARLGRLAGGRPGIALAYAAAPGAVVGCAQIGRTLLDLLDEPRAKRLTVVRQLLAEAAAAEALLAPSPPGAGGRSGPKRKAGAEPPPDLPADPTESGDEAATAAVDGASARRVPAAERRRAAAFLVDVWRAVARDLAVVQLGDVHAVRDVGLLDDLSAAARGLPAGSSAAFLQRLTRAGELLESNVSAELIADGLILAWPRRRNAA